MTTRKDATQNSHNKEHGKQGFASMSKEKVKEIASKGGQSHGKKQDENSSNRSSSSSSHTNQSRNEHHGKQGFASMSKEKVKEIASKGGQSHGKNHDSNNNRDR
ncbi:hypothetical protein IM40_03750 [Candidatus Paracaedimonas acanthamoebae]|nr:hypothetical protein IM40_03750 [Candidatus Paracaedimonas acanthamoebae]